MKTSLILFGIMLIMIGFTGCKPKEERAPSVPLEDFFKDPERSGYQNLPQWSDDHLPGSPYGSDECLCSESW